MDSSHVKFGLPLPLLPLPVRLITPLRSSASAGLRWICPILQNFQLNFGINSLSKVLVIHTTAGRSKNAITA
jgi:hypothetical protein